MKYEVTIKIQGVSGDADSTQRFEADDIWAAMELVKLSLPELAHGLRVSGVDIHEA